MHQLDEPAKQTNFADMVGVTQQAISGLVQADKLPKGGTYAEWLLIYCENLRDQASGRGVVGAGNFDAQYQKARLDKVRADLLEVELAEKHGEVVSVETFRPRLESALRSLSNNILGAASQIATHLSATLGVEVDPEIIKSYLAKTLTDVSDYRRLVG